jgi:hypothetical protein
METKILKSQERLRKKIKELEDDVYEKFLEGYLALLSFDESLQWSEANLNKIRKIDDLFSKELVQGLMAWIMSEMMGLSISAVDTFRTRGFKPKIDTVSMVERQLGWVNGKIVKGGYLDTLGSMESVKLQLKNYVMSSIAQTSKMPDFIRGFKEIVKGDSSILERYYELYAYDTFAKVVRTTDLQVALSLGLKHFIYQGGLIETSRQFCIKRDGLKFRIDQAEEWRDDPDLPGRDTHPGYNPLTDCGRWNCRHWLEFITEEEYLK